MPVPCIVHEKEFCKAAAGNVSLGSLSAPAGAALTLGPSACERPSLNISGSSSYFMFVVSVHKRLALHHQRDTLQRMEGNGTMQGSHRLLLAAAIFALIAITLFLVIWKWPQFLGLEPENAAPVGPTTEQKMEVLDQLRAASEPRPVTQDEKEAVIQQVTQPNAEEARPVTDEEKMNVLQSLQGMQ